MDIHYTITKRMHKKIEAVLSEVAKCSKVNCDCDCDDESIVEKARTLVA